MSTFKTTTPVDGSVYVERAYASGNDIDNALARAESAAHLWKSTPLEERKQACAEAVDQFVSNQSEICKELTWQMGRPIRFSQGEVNGFVERARYMIDIAESALAPIEIPERPGFVRYIRREPVGTVFVIAPWNYPYLTSVNAIVPALLAGNAVILKHSSQTPLCAEQLCKAFHSAGLPKGVFQYLHLTHESTTKVIQSGSINHVAFTGSVHGGSQMERSAAGHFLGVGLELGGKDPAYVRADADIAHAVETVTDGAFFNSGQSCCGIERVYVDRSVFDDFVSGMAKLVSQYELDRPDLESTTLGPVVRASAAEFVRQQTKRAIDAGAKTLIDEKNFPAVSYGGGYLAPQVFVDVDHTMDIMTEETFGPVVGVMPIDGDDEAIRLMNDSEYGLTACVFTQDQEAAVRIGDQIDTGTWFMNRCDYLDPALAWTGVKHSGRGCTLSSLGFEHLTRPKSYHLKIVGK